MVENMDNDAFQWGKQVVTSTSCCGGLLVEIADYIPFIDDDTNHIDTTSNSASYVPKSNNSTSVLQRKKKSENGLNLNPVAVEKGGVITVEKQQETDNIASDNTDSPTTSSPSTTASTAEMISSQHIHRSLQRPAKNLGAKFASANNVQCQDDSSVVWLGRYSNSFIAGPIGSGIHQNNSATYELSDTFQQKQIEIIERKYGGHFRAHRAATIIQRAFREHCLAKKWKQMRNPYTRRRLHRIHTLELPSPSHAVVRRQQTPDHHVIPISPRITDDSKKSCKNTNQNSILTHGGLRLHRYNVDRAGYQQTTGGRVRVIPIVPVNKKQSILSHESEVLRGESLAPQTSPKFVLGGGYSVLPLSLPSRQSDASLLSQESQGSSNSGESGSVEKENWASGGDLPSYLTYSQFKQSTARSSPTEVPKGRSVVPARLPISTSTVIPGSCWTSGSDLDTPSSDTGSCGSFGGAHPYRGSRGELIKSPRAGAQFRPVWVPRPETRTEEPRGVKLPQHSPVHLVNSDSLLTSRSVPETSVSYSPSENDLAKQTANHLINGTRLIKRNSEMELKRQYRIALNFFNKKPERGMEFLMQLGFVEANPRAVAKFLLSRRGLSKQMIGEYLGNLQNPFNSAVLGCFVSEVDLRGLEIDVALRKFQSNFRFPGEAQKIERIIEAFASHYCACNSESVRRFRHPDTVFILSFAVIMLNTDLHSPNVKAERRMKLNDFLKNLNGIDEGENLDQKMLAGIYQRVKDEEFRPGSDQVTQVMKVDRSIVGKKPVISLPHRRLVCYCRLYEIEDPQKKQSPTVHQREIFLFNDILVVTKILSRKKTVVTYSYRQSHSLVGMKVHPFRTQHYPHALKIHHTLENRVLLFNARSEDDKSKFLVDLKESIMESDQMEALRIEWELEKQEVMRPSLVRCDSQRDSGLPDISNEGAVRKVGRVLSNSVLELGAEAAANNPKRSGSVNSLDSGMSSTASVGSREMSPKVGTDELKEGEEKHQDCLFGMSNKGGTVPVQRKVLHSSTSSNV